MTFVRLPEMRQRLVESTQENLTTAHYGCEMRVNFNSKAGLNLYNGRAKTGVSVNGQDIKLQDWYSGAWTGSWRYAQYYIDGLGLTLTDSIAVLAYDDYGSSVVRLKMLGYNADALNPSTYVQSVKGTAEDAEIEAELTALGVVNTDPAWAAVLTRLSSNGARAKLVILDEDGMTRRSRNNIKSALGVSGGNSTITWFIVETHLEVFEDAEAAAMSAEFHKFADNVAWLFADADVLRPHVVATSTLNLKNFAEWRFLLPNDYLISSNTGAVDVP